MWDHTNKETLKTNYRRKKNIHFIDAFPFCDGYFGFMKYVIITSEVLGWRIKISRAGESMDFFQISDHKLKIDHTCSEGFRAFVSRPRTTTHLKRPTRGKKANLSFVGPLNWLSAACKRCSIIIFFFLQNEFLASLNLSYLKYSRVMQTGSSNGRSSFSLSFSFEAAESLPNSSEAVQ